MLNFGVRKLRGGINQIEIAHEGAKRRTNALADDAQSVLWSELWKLMRIARIGRPCAIYDASAAARTFNECKR